jgi:hypothetical protein
MILIEWKRYMNYPQLNMKNNFVKFFEELALMQCVEAKIISVFTKISILHELCNLKATLIRALNSIFYNSRYN